MHSFFLSFWLLHGLIRADARILETDGDGLFRSAEFVDHGGDKLKALARQPAAMGTAPGAFEARMMRSGAAADRRHDGAAPATAWQLDCQDEYRS
jgi:hypothetical protein